LTAAETASVTITATKGAQSSRCSYAITGEGDCGPGDPAGPHPLDAIIERLEAAVRAIDAFNPSFVDVAPEPVSIDDPTYTWHDQRGVHHVKVEIADGSGDRNRAAFKIPRMGSKRSFFKKCVRVKHAQQTIRVTTSRYDEDNPITGVAQPWIMRYRKVGTDGCPGTDNPADPQSVRCGIQSVSKARHGYKPNSVWLVKDTVTK
jgi:hypothetical protein